MRRLSRFVSDVLLAGAVVLAAIAVAEKVANYFGFTLTFRQGYMPSRLLELAAIALLFVIAFQLRELRYLYGYGGGRVE